MKGLAGHNLSLETREDQRSLQQSLTFHHGSGKFRVHGLGCRA